MEIPDLTFANKVLEWTQAQRELIDIEQATLEGTAALMTEGLAELMRPENFQNPEDFQSRIEQIQNTQQEAQEVIKHCGIIAGRANALTEISNMLTAEYERVTKLLEDQNGQ